MDFAYLVNILLKRKWLLLTVILASSVATWFFVGKLPPVYKAKSIVSTGIIDYKGVFQKDNPFIQKFQIESSFSGLIEKMKSRSSMKLLIDELLRHDMTAGKPFRVPKGEKLGLSQADFDSFAQKLKISNVDTAALATHNQDGIFNNRIAEAYRYDYETMWKKLEIKRIGETDYMVVEFEAESPELAFFVVETFMEKFLKMYRTEQSTEQNVALEFHTKQMDNRKKALDAKIHEINEYKRTNSLINVETQRESVIGQLKDLELKREEEAQKIPALKSSLALLKKEIYKYNKVTAEDYAGLVFFNDDRDKIMHEISSLQNKKVEMIGAGNKKTDAVDKRIEELQVQLAAMIDKTTALTTGRRQDKVNSQAESMIKESLQKQMDLEFAEEAYRSYDAEIARQQGRAGKLLSDDNHLNTLEVEHQRLEQEYLRATEEYDKAKLVSEGSKNENPVAVIEPAQMPDEPESSHRTVFSVFAGFASGTMASIVLFLLAFVDSSLQSPSQFQRVTRLPLAGYVNQVKLKNMNLQNLFLHTQNQGGLEAFKENIRKLRTAIETSQAKSFLFVSPKEQEGKSFLVVLLAYALSLNNKRILIIDTNFKNNTLSDFKTKSFIEITTDPSASSMGAMGRSGLKELPPPQGAEYSDPQLKNIDIVGNKGGSQSPSEVLAGKDFGKIMEQYGKKYDYIFLEAAAMNKFSDARELLPFADKVLAVFSTQVPVGGHDRDTIEFLRSLNGKMLGGILNNVDIKNL